MMAGKINNTDHKPEPVTIIINGQLPDIDSGIDMQDIFLWQAAQLSHDLFYSLPQGTYDKLIIELMKRKVSVYRGLTRS